MSRICVLLAMVAGCATTDIAKYDYMGEEVFLDPANTWANRAKPWTDLTSITVRVVNTRRVPVDALVSCRFDTGDKFEHSKVFGERHVRVEARDYSTAMVRGFHEGPGVKSRVVCLVVPKTP